jgi:hypothetical protein
MKQKLTKFADEIASAAFFKSETVATGHISNAIESDFNIS